MVGSSVQLEILDTCQTSNTFEIDQTHFSRRSLGKVRQWQFQSVPIPQDDGHQSKKKINKINQFSNTKLNTENTQNCQLIYIYKYIYVYSVLNTFQSSANVLIIMLLFYLYEYISLHTRIHRW